MFANPYVPLILTAFEGCEDKSYSHAYQSFIRSGLRKIFPRRSIEESLFGEVLNHEGDCGVLPSLPVVKKMDWKGQRLHSSILLLFPYQSGSEKFFYEMVVRWLLPGKRLGIDSFMSCNFSCQGFEGRIFTFAEIMFSLDSEYEFELVQRYFPIIEAEIRMGVVSLYQANRILEIKGLSSNEKTALIQEKISFLIHHRPQDFDYDIFGQMQHFLVTSQDEFKQARESHHMSRIIYVFYLFRKALKMSVEKMPEKRHISLKFSAVRLHFPLGVKKVLGVFIGMNFLKNHEIFEERHLLKAIRSYLPKARVVEGSHFVSTSKDDKTQILYLEIENEDGVEFAFNEIHKLRKKLPNDLKNNVEKLMPSLFMPRNEEEVMKNIITLSQELKYVRDIPQVIISFEEQTDTELSFTVVLLRLLVGSHELPLNELYKQISAKFKFVEDRVKKVGSLRRKYPKEATVFRLKMPKILFMREDHSVDLLKARQEVVKEIHRTVGEFRDYNGGMISKQNETLSAFKKLVAESSQTDELLLENFFHSIYPVEIRSMINPALLKNFFYMFVESSEKKLSRESAFEYRFHKIDEVLLIMTTIWDSDFKQKMHDLEKKMHLPSSQIVTFIMSFHDVSYQGYLLFGLSEERKNLFLQNLEQIYESSLSAFSL